MSARTPAVEVIKVVKGVRTLEVIVGVRAIARFLRVSNHSVLSMEKRGAPILRDEKGKLRVEKNALWDWFVRRKKAEVKEADAKKADAKKAGVGKRKAEYDKEKGIVGMAPVN